MSYIFKWFYGKITLQVIYLYRISEVLKWLSTLNNFYLANFSILMGNQKLLVYNINIFIYSIWNSAIIHVFKYLNNKKSKNYPMYDTCKRFLKKKQTVKGHEFCRCEFVTFILDKIETF